jgi:hypothetical protein
MSIREQEVHYHSAGLFLGCKGIVESAGVIIRETCDSVQVHPFTSRGKLGSCMIEVPTDPEVLHQLAEVFSRLAAEHQLDFA